MADSDYEEEIVDNVNDESVDWDNVDFDDNSPDKEVHKQRLDTIPEESYLSAVSRRPRSGEVLVTVPLDQDASRSFLAEDGLASSFAMANRTSDSTDFYRNRNFPLYDQICSAVDVRRILDEEKDAFDKSGRRLELPENFDPSNYKGLDFSWDKGYQYTQQRNAAAMERLDLAHPQSTEDKKCSVQNEEPKSDMDGTQENIAVSPFTPARRKITDVKTTPVRSRTERPEPLRSRNITCMTTTSTPKTREATSRLDLPTWDVSQINASTVLQNTTTDNTSNISTHKVVDTIKDMPATATSQQIFETLERIRLQKLHKKSIREQERASFLTATAPNISQRDRSITALPRRPLEPVQRLATVEEERLDNSRSSTNSRRSLKMSTSDTASSNIACSNSSRQPRTFNHMHQELSNQPIVRPMSQTMSRASSSASLSRAETRMTSSSVFSNGSLRIEGAAGRTVAFGCVALSMELMKTLTITNVGEVTLTIEAKVSGRGYELVDGNCIQLLPGNSTQLRIKFKPFDLSRHNSNLILNTNNNQKYTVRLRGVGGRAFVKMLPNENMQLSSSGCYILRNYTFHGNYNFRLKNDGILAFCKVLVFFDGQEIAARVSPSPRVVLKTNQELEFTVVITAEQISKTTNRRESIQSNASNISGVEIVILWGEEYFRQRCAEFLKKSGQHYSPDAKFNPEEQYLNQKSFKEPTDYNVSKTDIHLFEAGIQNHTIRIISTDRFSRYNSMEETVLRPDDTIALLMHHTHEKTLIRDYDETTVMQ